MSFNADFSLGKFVHVMRKQEFANVISLLDHCHYFAKSGYGSKSGREFYYLSRVD